MVDDFAYIKSQVKPETNHILSDGEFMFTLEVIKEKTLSFPERIILVWFGIHGSTTQSQASLANDLGIGQSTCERAIKRLRQMNVLRIVDDGEGHRTKYQLCHPATWRLRTYER